MNSKMERRGHPRIEIKDVHSFNDICDDMLCDFLESLQSKGLGFVREVDEVAFVYTQKSMKLYDRYCSRLSEVGSQYFNSGELDIKASSMIFP